MKLLYLFLFCSLFSARSFAICHLSLDPKDVTLSICKGLNPTISAESLKAIKATLDRMYHSRIVQGSEDHCGKLVDVVAGICKLPMVSAYFSKPGSNSIGKTVFRSQSEDARLILPPANASLPTEYAPSIFDFDCRQIGKEALTLTPSCGSLHRCELTTSTSCTNCTVTFQNGEMVAKDNATGAVIQMTVQRKGQLRSYSLYGSCYADKFSNWAEYYDKKYVMANPGTTASPRTARPVPFCNSGSASCMKYRIPLLKQNSQDLLDLVSKKTRVARAQDVGFCAPTTLGMMMIGLQNQSASSFGDSIDAVQVNSSSGENTFNDPVDGIVAKNWSGSVFRAGQLMGTDWWVGGTSSDQNGAVLKGSLGQAAGSIDDFMGTRNGYSNTNLIDFFNKFGGLVQVSLGMDVTTTGKEGVYHSLLLAGHSNGHLNMMDPWGRMYLVDMNLESQNAVFHRMNDKMKSYADASGKVFSINYVKDGRNWTATWTFGAPPKVGDLFPAWWWNSVALQEAAAQFEAVAAVTRVTKTGEVVPTVKHIDSSYSCAPGVETDFIACAPSQKARLIPGTEVAAVNPGQGAFFDAAESQNIMDMLYGVGQRSRGIAFANNLGSLSDAALAAATAAVKNSGGWIGGVTEPLVSSQSSCRPPMTLIGGNCDRICPTGMVEMAGNFGTPCKGSYTCWAPTTSGLVSGAVSASPYNQVGWYAQCMNGETQLAEGCHAGGTLLIGQANSPCGNGKVCARLKTDGRATNYFDGTPYGMVNWFVQCEQSLTQLKPGPAEMGELMSVILGTLLDDSRP